MENLEDAASGSYEVLPRKTLRERGYGVRPIRLQPDYGGNFLDKLPIEGKPLEASDPTNLLDFSSPEEMLKHQDEPNPRVILDEFAEFPGRLTDTGEWDNRERTQTDYDDRGWDETDSPEMSEDKIWRMWENPRSKRVVEAFLKESNHQIRFGMFLNRLEESILPSKGRRRNVRQNRTNVRLFKEDAKNGKWEFKTGTHALEYRTVFQFIPKGNETDLSKLDVKVSCNCNSWFFWGAQYNAHIQHYLEGEVMISGPHAPPRAGPGKGPYKVVLNPGDPEKRDPGRVFLACKHIVACIPTLLTKKYDLSDLSENILEKRKEELEKEPGVKVVLPKEKIEVKVPPKLEKSVKYRRMLPDNTVERWERMSPFEKKRDIEALNNPDDVHYLGVKFPNDEDTIKLVHKKLYEMANDRSDVNWLTARKYLRLYEMGPRVVCAHLMDRFPIETVLNYQNVKVAKLLHEFEDSMIYSSKDDLYKKLDYDGVTVELARAEPRSGRWSFNTTSGDDNYSTIFQFLPFGNVREANKLHVRVSCSCPSFLYWGAQFNAVMGDYLYGDIRPKFTPPQFRDPNNKFKVCKHIMACIPVVSKYRVMEIGEDTRKRLQEPPRFDLKDFPKEKLRIPENLLSIGKQKGISKAVKEWDKMSPQARRKLIMGLGKSDQVAYMAHRFPDTATLYAVDRMKQLAGTDKMAGEFLRYWF
jgi:hypothetical protein